MKYLVLLAFIAIIGSLGSALFFMMRDGQDGKPKTNNMARALAFRVGFSILLFVCILVAWKLGYIQPTRHSRRGLIGSRERASKGQGAHRAPLLSSRATSS